jgi:hypothetical protein
MRVLLRDASTGLYLIQPDGWTAESERAQSFRHSAEAMDCARDLGVERGEVILDFEESCYSVCLPLP